MGSQDRALPTHAQNFEPHHSVECDSPPKNWVLTHPVMPHPISLLIADYILEKVSLIAFRQIVSKLLPLVHIFSFIITTYLKNFIGVKSITTKQFPPELSPWIIPPVFPISSKMFPLVSSCLLPPPCTNGLAPSPKPTVLGKPCRLGKNPPQKQKNAHFKHHKNSPHQTVTFM